MKKVLALFAIVSVTLSTVACTNNSMAKRFGGTMNVSVPADKQLVNVTWKENSLWVLTTDREVGHKPMKYYFEEDSSFGIVEGKVVLTEQ